MAKKFVFLSIVAAFVVQSYANVHANELLKIEEESAVEEKIAEAEEAAPEENGVLSEGEEKKVESAVEEELAEAEEEEEPTELEELAEAQVEPEEHGEAGEEEEGKACSASIILLGGVAFIMAIFYMVNSHFPAVQEQTWSMLTSAVSIFAAVMAFNALNGAVTFAYIHVTSEEKETPKEKVSMSAFLMFFWYAVVALMLFFMKSNKLRLVAYGTIGGHVLGFAAIDLYSLVSELPVFRTSPGMILAVKLIYLVTMPLLVGPIALVFKTLGSRFKMATEDIDRCHEQATDTAIDFFCMGLSFLIAMFLRSLISFPRTGENVGKEADGTKHTDMEVFLLVLAGVFFAVASGVTRVVHKRMAEANKGRPTETLLNIMGTTSSLAAAWCLLFSADWFFLHRIEDPLIAKASVAVFCSAVFVIAVHGVAFAVNQSKDLKRVIKGEFTAIALMVGLSWEAVFSAGVEGISLFGANDAQEHTIAFGISLLLLLIVFPAWVVYILPKHNKELIEEYQGVTLRPWYAFCDCELCEDDDEYEDVDVEDSAE